jgi:hypothetical protein
MLLLDPSDQPAAPGNYRGAVEEWIPYLVPGLEIIGTQRKPRLPATATPNHSTSKKRHHLHD